MKELVPKNFNKRILLQFLSRQEKCLKGIRKKLKCSRSFLRKSLPRIKKTKSPWKVQRSRKLKKKKKKKKSSLWSLSK